MKFKLNIQNFGKIEQATIQINHLTVLSGQNNVGKSFVSKALYSFFHTIVNVEFRQTQKLLIETIELVLSYLADLRHIKQFESSIFNIDIAGYTGSFRELLMELIDLHPDIDKHKFNIAFNKTVAKINSLIADMNRVKDEMENKLAVPRIISDFKQNLDKFKEMIATISNEERLIQNIQQNFRQNLQKNFQVSKLQQLKRVASLAPISFEVESIGKISIQSESVTLETTLQNIEILRNLLTRIIYLESPIYWKLKSALVRPLFGGSYRSTRPISNRHLTGVPNYFYEVITLLELQPLEEPKFKDILEQIEQEIGGRLLLSNDGNFVFHTQNEGTHALSITALGVANLGMIAMLLEKNLIDEGTFLFIDEPEAHLHPAWQVILMKALFELARKGVNVVITTHSIDMLKCLEVLAKEDEHAKDLIALNHLGTNGHSLNEEADFDEKLNLIKRDLLEPFHQLYIAGL